MNVVQAAVEKALKNFGLDTTKTLRKSYVVTSDNKLLKNFDGELPKGATEINPFDVDQDTWDNVPKNIQNNILRDEMKRRIFS